MALKQYCLALKDTEFCHGSSCSAEVGCTLMLQQLDQPNITRIQASNVCSISSVSLLKCVHINLHTSFYLPEPSMCSVCQSVGADILVSWCLLRKVNCNCSIDQNVEIHRVDLSLGA